MERGNKMKAMETGREEREKKSRAKIKTRAWRKETRRRVGGQNRNTA